MIRNSLLNNLSQFKPEKIDEALKKTGVRPSARAETVSIDQFVELANELTLS
jgi:16S rRNA A1518/A1519 N6-dimethyltransferase RsmA/KsgA/DIM1 with predicted DNA glycosylase/AP lyase activity